MSQGFLDFRTNLWTQRSKLFLKSTERQGGTMLLSQISMISAIDHLAFPLVLIDICICVCSK